MRRCLSYGIKGGVVVESEADQLINAATTGARCLSPAALQLLPGLAGHWPREPEGSRLSCSLKWDELMRGRVHLTRMLRIGAHSPDQARRCQTLPRTDRRLLPPIERLDLYHPAFDEVGFAEETGEISAGLAGACDGSEGRWGWR